GDGAIRVRWPELRNARLFRDQIDALEALAASSGTRGRILPSPLWQLLPDRMQFLLDNDRGPLLTVHPLGGCAIGADRNEGVVDDLGRVFDASSDDEKEPLHGLVVLDGSIVPVALGTNPALTIAALASRAVEGLRVAWGYAAPPACGSVPVERPVFRELPRPQAPRPTEVEFTERMSGPATLLGKDGREMKCVIELTLPFKSCSVASLVRPAPGTSAPMKRSLDVLDGRLRVFKADDWTRWRRHGERDEETPPIQLHARLSGTLCFLHREPTTKCQRVRPALCAWSLNRGLRDTWQWIAERWKEGGFAGFFAGSRAADKPADDPAASNLLGDILRRAESALALASRGGEVRLLEYELTV